MIERTVASCRRVGLVVVAALAVWSFVGSPEAPTLVAAQATPEVGNSAEASLGCLGEPITGERLVAALDAATPRPLDTLSLETLPTGEPVDSVTLDAITMTVETALDCRNAGDFARAYALFSDRMIGQLFGGRDSVPPEIVRALAEPPRPVRRRARVDLVELSVASLLPDGRAGAVVETANATHGFTDYLFFTEIEGRWLIDEAVVIAVVDPAATPVP
ncbi:MAG: hypothetical protein M3464_06255 [Chloroflexota bacterium]|nr:hypothetical protein [Chloroflexota bacterium]